MSNISDRESLALPADQTSRIMFLEPRPRGVLIDLVSVSGDSIRPGTPFSIEASLPWSAWALAAAGTLELWARSHAEVNVNFETAGGIPRMRMWDAQYRLLLDVRTSAAEDSRVVTGRANQPVVAS